MTKIFLFISVFCSILCFLPKIKTSPKTNSFADASTKPLMSIVIDDFGSYDQSGVEILKKSTVPLTCAVIPFVDNTKQNIIDFKNLGHEIILHMPMESHVHLPEDWYGPVYIKNTDSIENVNKKLTECLNEVDDVKGFNIHIGSGVSQNKTLMKAVYEFAKSNHLYFLDSRTIETKATENASAETQSVYLGRDVFLEADKNRSYSGVCQRLLEGANIATKNGHAIVIGHVGAEGGENTAKAILDTVSKIQEMGVEIVPLSKLHSHLSSNKKVCE